MEWEDVSWHSEACHYGSLVKHNHKSSLISDEEMRQDLQVKYTKEVLNSRVSTGGKGKKKRPNTRARSSSSKQQKEAPLTPVEEAEVKKKVDAAMGPNTFVRSYLDEQRRDFEKMKEQLRLQCRCVKRKETLPAKKNDAPMPKLEAVGGNPVVQEAREDEPRAEAMGHYVEEDDEEEEYGLFF